MKRDRPRGASASIHRAMYRIGYTESRGSRTPREQWLCDVDEQARRWAWHHHLYDNVRLTQLEGIVRSYKRGARQARQGRRTQRGRRR